MLLRYVICKGLYIQFAGLWNGQKQFRNTSGRHTKICQERSIKLKCKCNDLFTCLSFKKKKNTFKKIYSFVCSFRKLKKMWLRLLLCCGGRAETSPQVQYLRFCGSCRLCQHTCGNRHLECLLLFPYPSGFGSTWCYYPRFGANFFFRWTHEAALCLLGRKMCIRVISEYARAPRSATLLL